MADELVRTILRRAKNNDPDAWDQIEKALQRQLINIKGLTIWVVIHIQTPRDNTATHFRRGYLFLEEKDANKAILDIIGHRIATEDVDWTEFEGVDACLARFHRLNRNEEIIFDQFSLE